MDMVEVDGRIMMLQQQRDENANRCVVLNGTIAILQKQIEELKKPKLEEKPE